MSVFLIPYFGFMSAVLILKFETNKNY